MTKRILPGAGDDDDDRPRHSGDKRARGDESAPNKNIESRANAEEEGKDGNNDTKHPKWLLPPMEVRHPRIGANYQAILPPVVVGEVGEDGATAVAAANGGSVPVSQETEGQTETDENNQDADEGTPNLQEPDAAAGGKDLGEASG